MLRKPLGWSAILTLLVWLPLATSAAAGFTLYSSNIPSSGQIPQQMAYNKCGGHNQPPRLSWHGAPAATRSFVLTLFDPDAPGSGFWHWLVYNLPASTHALNHQRLPAMAKTLPNSYGFLGYGGPCPPSGQEHRYVFTLYALDRLELHLPQDATPSTLLQALSHHVLAKTLLLTHYAQPKGL